MNDRILSLVVIVIVFLSSGLRVSAQQGATSRAATLPNLTAQVSVDYNAVGQAMVIVDFSTDDPKKQNVYCLSSFQDLQFVLRDDRSLSVRQLTYDQA